MLTITSSEIDAVKLVGSKHFCDPRGVFSETYNRARFHEHGLTIEFVQDNQSSSVKAGTIRGLHFQSHPMAQDKLIRVLKGSVFDVAVDLRRSSPTYGQWVSEILSADNGKQLLIPVGFAHGFCTLEPDTHVFYKVSKHFSPPHDLGLAWDDADLAIAWPLKGQPPILSDKDTRQPSFRSLPAYFN